MHTNRVLQELRTAGLIALKERTLVVLDWEELKKAGDFDAGMSDCPQPHQQLAQEVGHRAVRFAPGDDDPLPKDRGIDQRLAPERARDPRVTFAKGVEGVVLDEPNDTRRDRANAEIQDIEMEALEVGHVARHMEVEDLAIARPRDLVGARDAVLNST